MASETVEISRLKTLIEVNSLISSSYSDYDALLVRILESAMRLVECGASSLFLSDAGNSVLNLRATMDSVGVRTAGIPHDTAHRAAAWVFGNNRALVINDVEREYRFCFPPEDGIKKLVALPLRTKNVCRGVVQLVNKAGGKNFSKSDLEILELFAEQAGIVCEAAAKFSRLQAENDALVAAPVSDGGRRPFLVHSSVMRDLAGTLDEIARSDISVLIFGERGVGKELVAEQIHLRGGRASEPFVKIDCAVSEPELLERGLFGGEAAAGETRASAAGGTGSASDGFERARGGTIFLDEVGSLPPDLQDRLLAVMQSRSSARTAALERGIPSEARIVASTSCDLEALVQEGKFRRDLFYRLNLLPLSVPPLRNRRDDIEALALLFCRECGGRTGRRFEGFSEDAVKALHSYYWPGNVLELRNAVERACILGTPPLIRSDDLPLPRGGADGRQEGQDCWPDSDGGDRSLRAAVNRFKKAYITRILNETSWNQTEAGKILGIQRTYVSRLLNELHIR